MRIIAECGPNHNGSLETALEMVSVAKECGADTIKFQHIDPMHFKPGLTYFPGDGSIGYILRDLFTKVRFSKDQWRALMLECEEQDIGFLCTPQTVWDFEDLLDLGVKEVKISSDNLRNEALLRRVAESEIPAILSSGMATAGEFSLAENILIKHGVTGMLCTSEYPCPPESVKISCLGDSFYSSKFQGFSDHTQGTTAAVMALALGATVFEKHFTLDPTMEGPDHSWSAEPEDLKEYVDTLREAELMLGSGEFKPTEKELELKKLLEA